MCLFVCSNNTSINSICGWCSWSSNEAFYQIMISICYKLGWDDGHYLNFTTVGSNPHRLTISTQVRGSSCWIGKVCQHVYLPAILPAQVVTHSSKFSLKQKILAERSNADFPTFREIRQLEAEARFKNYYSEVHSINTRKLRKSRDRPMLGLQIKNGITEAQRSKPSSLRHVPQDFQSVWALMQIAVDWFCRRHDHNREMNEC